MHFNAIFALLQGQVASLADTARVDLVSRQSPPLRQVQGVSFGMFLKFQYRLQYRLLGKVKSLLFGLTVGCSMGGIRKPVGLQISAEPKHQQKHIQLSAPVITLFPELQKSEGDKMIQNV